MFNVKYNLVCRLKPKTGNVNDFLYNDYWQTLL